ncbi:MAG: PAS domain S-box protein [Anaerolineae bacterium]|nr:PAS domain S-box protein [Anaerolineae bacterium]
MFLLPDFRVRQRDYLLEISRAMTAQLDLGEVLRLILRASVKLLVAEVGLIALREGGQADLRVRAVIGVAPEQVGVFAPLLTGVTDDPGDEVDIPDFDRKLAQIGRDLGIPVRQAIALPMYLGDEFVGLIYLFRTISGTASLNDRMVLQSFADQAAIAVHNARLYEQVNRERKRLGSILEHSADGVMILDANRNVLSFNRAMRLISGWHAEHVIGKPYDAIVQWASRPQGIDLAEAMQTGWPFAMDGQRVPGTLYVEGDLVRPDATSIGVGITYAPLIEDNRLINVIVNVRDITHFREAQQMKSAFISEISHELKTPVALIKGYAGTLRREDANWDPTITQQSLAVIEEEADRLTALIENLLAASKLQAEGMRLRYEEVSLVKIAEAAVARLQTQTDRHRLLVEFPDDFPPIPGDADRLRQVFDNLIGNAIKYSPDGGDVQIRGTFTDEEVRVTVQDHGVGLPEYEWGRIFERFYRVDGTLARKTKGTGLGLYLSRAVIEAHGGDIGVDSMPGRGSTFYFTLPRRQTYQPIERRHL